MENATKALIIAGSILVAILLIAMGVKIFNSTSGTSEQVSDTMTTTEIMMFNNKFTQYQGSSVSYSKVMSLVNAVIANNSVNSNKNISISYNSRTYSGKTLKNESETLTSVLTNGKTYSVDMTGYSTEGLINSITIQLKNS